GRPIHGAGRRRSSSAGSSPPSSSLLARLAARPPGSVRVREMSSIVGSGAASGGAKLLPEVLAFSSSLPLDRPLLREDGTGSMAHLIMLSRTGIVPREAAARIRGELVKAAALDPNTLPDEEDVHMAVETVLAG